MSKVRVVQSVSFMRAPRSWQWSVSSVGVDDAPVVVLRFGQDRGLCRQVLAATLSSRQVPLDPVIEDTQSPPLTQLAAARLLFEQATDRTPDQRRQLYAIEQGSEVHWR